MSKKAIILRHPSSNRRQPLLRHQPTSSSSISAGKTRRFAEVAGATAADCAAVCCCCPCGLVNLLVLAVYKVPAGIFRRALRNRRRRDRRKIAGAVSPPNLKPKDEIAIAAQIHPIGYGISGDDGDKEVEALEKEMWERFYGTGFWRSPSQREVPISLSLHLQEQVS